MWEVSDRLCVDVAKNVYETILKAYLDDASVAYGLHHAVRMLRAALENYDDKNQMQRDVKKTVPISQAKGGPFLWAAFIHIGV
ncbi:hypothetical protein O1611_g8047 [Lasiodiplodia mahajangana]|uniref:Uncharacterized protein n=1 Tax=Lasiodiplodia mahajangana TaxID=1108764 RepID=A0ACC2JDY7_9PEZI|nr:hypothetical protein O1611_g8047 [Lasiodiplodia mahajangana]